MHNRLIIGVAASERRAGRAWASREQLATGRNFSGSQAFRVLGSSASPFTPGGTPPIRRPRMKQILIWAEKLGLDCSGLGLLHEEPRRI
jgi:hypothetical protein